MEIREQIARAIFLANFPTWNTENFSEIDHVGSFKLADVILALPDLPENLKRLKLYPKLVEALDYMMGTGYDSTKLTAAEEILAEAKKLEGK